MWSPLVYIHNLKETLEHSYFYQDIAQFLGTSKNSDKYLILNEKGLSPWVKLMAVLQVFSPVYIAKGREGIAIILLIFIKEHNWTG